MRADLSGFTSLRLHRRRASRLPAPIVSSGLLFLLLIYITSFWGKVGLLLPSPLDNWHFIFYRGLMRWSESAGQLLSVNKNITLYGGVEAMVLGLVAPVALLSLFWRRSPADLGLCWTGGASWFWTLFGVALSVPIGLWITVLVPSHGSVLTYSVYMLCMIPEHFLIFGVGIALLLPERRLPSSRPRATIRDGVQGVVKVARGASKSKQEALHVPSINSLALSQASLFAIVGSAILFVAVHVGAKPVELAFSVPMGIFCGYVTWRTASIWPALIFHWSLNLLPLALRQLFW